MTTTHPNAVHTHWCQRTHPPSVGCEAVLVGDPQDEDATVVWYALEPYGDHKHDDRVDIWVGDEAMHLSGPTPEDLLALARALTEAADRLDEAKAPDGARYVDGRNILHERQQAQGEPR